MYKVKYFQSKNEFLIEDFLNDMYTKGWEIVSVNRSYYIFKNNK